MNTRARFSWADLPQELLEIIAKRLGSRDNIRRFRAICKDWRRSVPSTAFLCPLLPYYLRCNYPELSSSSLVLVSTSVCLLRPVWDSWLAPWFVTVEQFDFGKVLRRPPFTRSAYSSPMILDLNRFHVTELFKGYYLRSRDGTDDKCSGKRWSDYNIKKVVLSVNGLASNTPAHIDDCTAFVLYNEGKLLAVTLGNAETRVNLKVPGFGNPAKFDDIVNYNCKIYAINRKGQAYTINYGTLKVDEVVGNPIGSGNRGDRKKWLVPSWSTSELYLISRCDADDNNDYMDIKIYKLDEQGRCWRQITRLGDDRILFVTFDGCFFATLRNFEVRLYYGDCIVCYPGCFPRYDTYAATIPEAMSSSDLGVYCASKFSSIFYPYSEAEHLLVKTIRNKMLTPGSTPAWVSYLRDMSCEKYLLLANVMTKRLADVELEEHSPKKNWF